MAFTLARALHKLTACATGRDRQGRKHAVKVHRRRPFLEVLEDRISPAIVVTTLADVVDPTDGLTSLREAILQANSTPGGDTIQFLPAFAGGTILLNGTQLPAISANVDILGPTFIPLHHVLPITIDAQGMSRILEVEAGATVEISRLVLTGGKETGFSSDDFPGKGGAILNFGNLTIDACVIRNNQAREGAGIYNSSAISGPIVDALVVPPQPGNLTILGSTISGNDAVSAGTGGGIFNAGVLQVTDTTVRNNIGDGIFNEGNLSITQSTVNDNSTEFGDGGAGIENVFSATATIATTTIRDNVGGGILNEGDFTLTQSTVSHNSADSGGTGGIENIGRMTLFQSTVSENTSRDDVGGITNIGTLAIDECTISGNLAGGVGGIENGDSGVMTITQSTISNNTATASLSEITGGVWNFGTITIGNSIIAGNPFATPVSATTEFVEFDVRGAFNSQGSNLIGVVNGATGFTGPGDLVGHVPIPGDPKLAPIDPKLAPLAFNGGPTQTMALLPGSPAIDAGNNSLAMHAGLPLTTDQRGPGFPRTAGAAVDIGAFEFKPALLLASPIAFDPEAVVELNSDTLTPALHLLFNAQPVFLNLVPPGPVQVNAASFHINGHFSDSGQVASSPNGQPPGPSSIWTLQADYSLDVLIHETLYPPGPQQIPGGQVATPGSFDITYTITGRIDSLFTITGTDTNSQMTSEHSQTRMTGAGELSGTVFAADPNNGQEIDFVSQQSTSSDSQGTLRQRVPGNSKWGPVTFERGHVQDQVVANWMETLQPVPGSGTDAVTAIAGTYSVSDQFDQSLVRTSRNQPPQPFHVVGVLTGTGSVGENLYPPGPAQAPGPNFQPPGPQSFGLAGTTEFHGQLDATVTSPAVQIPTEIVSAVSAAGMVKARERMTADLSVSVGTTDIAVDQGSSVDVAVSIALMGDAEGELSVSIAGLPSDVTGTFVRPNVGDDGDDADDAAAGAGTGMLVFSVGADAPVGTFTVMLTVMDGGLEVCLALTLTIGAG